jgi:hypothetical protein
VSQETESKVKETEYISDTEKGKFIQKLVKYDTNFKKLEGVFKEGINDVNIHEFTRFINEYITK